MEVYNKNRDKNQGMHDEIREQNAKLKDAPLKDKIAYYKEYYLKATLAISCHFYRLYRLYHDHSP